MLGGQDQPRAPELFVAGELLAAGGRAVVEVMLHEAAHALATKRGIKDTSAAGNRYHNKRFVAPAAELGLRGPDVRKGSRQWGPTGRTHADRRTPPRTGNADSAVNTRSLMNWSRPSESNR